MSKNDITGDRLVSKVNSKEYEDNYDRIFRQKEKKIIRKMKLKHDESKKRTKNA